MNDSSEEPGMIDEVETNPTGQREWVPRAIAILLGVAFGWFANDLFGARYHIAFGGAPAFRINTRTGETMKMYYASELKPEEFNWIAVSEPQ